jgi:hypothetical protein
MKVLLITPNFFDYPVVISDEIRSMGHEVDWFDDRPSTNSFVKSIIRINKNLISGFIKKYYNNILVSIKEKKYDKVLLISGQSLSFNEKMLIGLKKLQPQAEFILYQWDSIENFGYIKSLQKHFDRCYSFDRFDVKNNPELYFLPLFYSRRYETIGNKTVSAFKYDACFIGTAHPKKYKYVSMMSEQLKAVYKNQFIYFFFPSRLVFFYRKFMNSELKNAHYNEFHYVPVTSEKMEELITESKCIFDSAQSGQIGLTIRVIECLGAKRKIITTSKDVVNYDFYKEENIYLYDGTFDLKSKFFTEPYVEIEPSIYSKYSLRSWLKVLIEQNYEEN